ncbi:hypothetical protein MLD38_021733 [Melastoma candidum]|uniref:Uncharacterized protein n=1 Tax=Melastoma candidum TaxID=119954 RepID=A0ACB9QH73_9MYRT|nr:hypothetical protein MLD38_021733 [Melastoma candidum]
MMMNLIEKTCVRFRRSYSKKEADLKGNKRTKSLKGSDGVKAGDGLQVSRLGSGLLEDRLGSIITATLISYTNISLKCIFLDAGFEPHLSDFGLARLMNPLRHPLEHFRQLRIRAIGQQYNFSANDNIQMPMDTGDSQYLEELIVTREETE